MEPEHNFGVSLPVRKDSPSLAFDLLFYGGITAAIPAVLAWLMRAFMPASEPLLLLGNAFASFGLVQTIFAERKLKHAYDPTAIDHEDQRVMAQEWVCGRATSCSALVAGSTLLYAIVLYPYLRMQFGADVGYTGTTIVILLTLACCSRIATRGAWRVSQTPRPPRVAMLASVGTCLAAVIGTAAPFVVCVWMAMLWRG